MTIPLSRRTYERDARAIYRQSFATIRVEADLARFSADEAAIAVRAIHASGMVDIAGDLRFGGDVAGTVRGALARGAPVLVDTRMVGAGIARRHVPAGADIHCFIDDPEAARIAQAEATTRAAAAVELWRAHLAGAVVVIGNAPTAVFALLDAIDAGAPRPAAVLAFPVGFVGAVESKAELVADPRGLTYATLLGRRGGSAIAGAAFNAILIGAEDR